MTYKYLVIIEKTDTGFSAYSPDVPGCAATAKTAQAAQAAMNEAIEFHLEGLAQVGEPIPEPHARHGYAIVKAVKKAKPLRYAAYHIVPAEGKWIVKKTGAMRASAIYRNKTSAIGHAKHLASKSTGRVVVHNKDGTTRQIDSRAHHASTPGQHEH